jgi:hypothetical protein
MHCAQEIIDKFRKLASNYGDEKELKKHFKNNQTFYNYDPESDKKKETIPIVEGQEELDPVQLSIDLDKFLSIVGKLLYAPDVIADHPEVKAAEEAKLEALKTAEDIAFQKFKDLFISAISKEKDKIESISTMGDTAFLDFRIIDADKLKENKDEISVASYAEGFKERIVNSLYSIAKNKKMTTVVEIKRIAKALLSDFCTDDSLKILFEEYKKSKNDISPSGFASWINQSAISADFKSFEKHFKKEWADKVIGAIDSFRRECKNKGLSFKADRSLVDNNLKRILGEGIGKMNKQPGLEIHKKFMAQLPAEKVLDYALIDTVWQKTLLEAGKPEFMKELCFKFFIEETDNLYEIEEAINSIDTTLPNIDAIVVELYNSRYYSKPLPLPKSKNPLTIRTIIQKEGREKQFMDLVFEIPLRFEVRKGKNNEMLYHPLPSQNISDLSIRESFGFNISNIQNVYVGKTADVTKNGFLETITDYSWRFSVIDTSEQTVIQEPKVGEMIMVDANMGKLTGLDELGINPLGFQVKFVGNNYGHTEKILGKITLMGMPFIVGWGKEGAIGYFESPMAFKEAELQYKYGNQNMDLYISCRVKTYIGADYSIRVEAENIKLGMQNGAFEPKGLNLTEKITEPIIIDRPGKVE